MVYNAGKAVRVQVRVRTLGAVADGAGRKSDSQFRRGKVLVVVWDCKEATSFPFLQSFEEVVQCSDAELDPPGAET